MAEKEPIESYTKQQILEVATELKLVNFQEVVNQISTLQSIADKASQIEFNTTNEDEEDKSKTKSSISDIFEGFKAGYDDFFSEVKESYDNWYTLGTKAFDKSVKTISKIADTFSDFAIDLFKDAIATMKEIAEWDILNSNKFNTQAVEIYQNYGLTGKDAYAMNEALKSQGFGSIDDFLTNLPFMNQKQLDYMKEIAENSANNYDASLEASLKFQEFQKEYDLFKKELQSSIIDFFMSNKDVIMWSLETIITVLDGIAKTIDFIVSIFKSDQTRSENEKKKDILDILQSNNSNNKIFNDVSNVVNNNSYDYARTYSDSINNNDYRVTNQNSTFTVNNSFYGANELNTRTTQAAAMNYAQLIQAWK